MKRMSASQCHNNRDSGVIMNVAKEESEVISTMGTVNKCSDIKEKSQNLENELKENESLVKPGKQMKRVDNDDDFTCKQCKRSTTKPVTSDKEMSAREIVIQIFDQLKDDKYNRSSYNSFCSWCFRIIFIVLFLMAVGLSLFVYVNSSGNQTYTSAVTPSNPQLQLSHTAQAVIGPDSHSNTDSNIDTSSDSNNKYAAMFNLDQNHLQGEKKIRWNQSSDCFSLLTTKDSCIVVPVSGIYGVFTTLMFKYFHNTSANAVGYLLMKVKNSMERDIVQKASITLPSTQSRVPRSLLPASLSAFIKLSQNEKICVDVDHTVIDLIYESRIDSYISIFKLP